MSLAYRTSLHSRHSVCLNPTFSISSSFIHLTSKMTSPRFPLPLSTHRTHDMSNVIETRKNEASIVNIALQVKSCSYKLPQKLEPKFGPIGVLLRSVSGSKKLPNQSIIDPTFDLEAGTVAFLVSALSIPTLLRSPCRPLWQLPRLPLPRMILWYPVGIVIYPR